MAELAAASLLAWPPEYDAELATELMLASCAGVYTAAGTQTADPNLLLEESRTPGADGAEIFVRIERQEETMTVIFRGSSTIQDWLLDLSFLAVNAEHACDDTNIDTLVQGSDVYGASKYTTRFAALVTFFVHTMRRLFVDEPIAHRGFLVRAIKYSRWVEDVAARAYPGEGMSRIRKMIVSGHSLGGGAASAFAYWCAKAYPHMQLVCYTFEAPLLGNYALQRDFIERVPLSFAHRVKQDVVTVVPPWYYSAARYRITWRPSWKGLAELASQSAVHVHTAPYRCFIPWLRASHPEAYESKWEAAQAYKMKQSPYDPRAPQLTTLAKAFPYLAPDFGGSDDHPPNLALEQMSSLWIDRKAHPYPAVARAILSWLQTLVTLSTFAGACLLARCLLSQPVVDTVRAVGLSLYHAATAEGGAIALAVGLPLATAVGASLGASVLDHFDTHNENSVPFGAVTHGSAEA